MQTLAAVLTKFNQPLEILDLEIPRLKSGQILVKVAYSGVCHTQLLEIQGKRGIDKYLPHTLGHEGSGIVLEVGEGVKKVKAGDPVVLSWIKGNGAEVPNTEYKNGHTKINAGAITTFMNTTVICENRVTKIPEAMPLKEACLLGCAIPTGFGMVMKTARVRAGSSVAVFGIGGIGLSAIAASRLMNAETIIAIDIHEEKLKQALALGATHTIHADREEPIQVIREVTSGHGVDYAFETAGRRETMETAFEAIRHSGGLCVIAGNLAAGEKININPFELIRGKQILGSAGGETQPDKDIPYYTDLYLSQKLNLANFITHHYDLKDINLAFKNLGEGKVGRALIDMKNIYE